MKKEKKTFHKAIVGGGAAGIMAAIASGRKGRHTVVLERMPRLGKKLLASGSGRCNLSNTELSEKYFNSNAGYFVAEVFSKFGREDILRFFTDIGVHTYAEDKRIFPVTNQSSSVLRALEMELARLPVEVVTQFEVAGITYDSGGFRIKSSDGREMISAQVVLAGGGRSYPSLGSDGSCYGLAERFGHTVVHCVPSCVPLIVRHPLCHVLQGQRIRARAAAFISGKIAREAEGELIFTKYGLSGTAILDVSGPVSVAMNRDKNLDVEVRVDLAPFLETVELDEEMRARLKKKVPYPDLLTGILPNKFGPAIEHAIKGKTAEEVTGYLKDMRFKVQGTRGWNEAEFTLGGIDIGEVMPGTLESARRKGLHFAGEILDVGGRRGGFNLSWAWASGYVAGSA
jgi:predicted Rossmann fold flavoprotein